jgi:nicotinate-nucleotide adenylyltransferase
MRLGIFGGTFDPPHIAHLILAQEALQQLALDRVLWVLTPVPPHKVGQLLTPLEQRLALLQAALGDDSGFELSRVDIDRPPPYFTVDTIGLLRRRYPQDQLVYLMGADSLFDLPYWRTPRQFVAVCDEIGVMPRPGKALDQESLELLESDIPGLAARLRLLEVAPIEVASSAIRRRIAGGQRYRYFLPEAVFRLIQEQGLYLEP